MTADGPTPFVANGKPPWSLSMSARDGTPAFLGAVFAKANAAPPSAAAKQRFFFALDDCGSAAAAAPLHAALAAAAAAPAAHEWVPDVAAVLAANQLLEARQREQRESDEEALRKSSVEAQTSMSNARDYMNSHVQEGIAAEEMRQVASALAAGELPVFTVVATGLLVLPAPGTEDAAEPERRFFRPWFFSLTQLERMLNADSPPEDGPSLRHVCVDTFERLSGRSLYGVATRELAASDDDGTGAVAPLFVGHLGAEMLPQLVELLDPNGWNRGSW